MNVCMLSYNNVVLASEMHTITAKRDRIPERIGEGLHSVLGNAVRCVICVGEKSGDAGRIDHSALLRLDQWKKRQSDVNETPEIDVTLSLVIFNGHPFGVTVVVQHACVVQNSPKTCSNIIIAYVLNCIYPLL